MNQNQEEEKIRKLFAQQREVDKRATPSFAGNWRAAGNRVGITRHRRNVFRFAAAVAVVVAVGALAVALTTRSTSRKPAVVIVPSHNIGVSISEWRSPTAVLLKPVDWELFKTFSQSDAPNGNL